MEGLFLDGRPVSPGLPSPSEEGLRLGRASQTRLRCLHTWTSMYLRARRTTQFQTFPKSPPPETWERTVPPPPPPGAMSQLFDPASPGQGLTPAGPPQASRRQTARSLRAIPEAAPSSSHCLALELPRPTARAHAHRYERSTNSSPATCYPASLERRIPNLGATLRRQISLSPTTAGKHLPRTFFSV